MITKEDQVPLFVTVQDEVIIDAQTDAVVIKILLNTLEEIASEKRTTKAKLSAKATLNFIHSQTKDKYKEPSK